MTDEQRHPDHERVKAKLVKAWHEKACARHGIDSLFDALAAEAIAMGARAPDPKEKLTNYVADLASAHRGGSVGTDRYFAEKIVTYILDNAPKEG